MIRRSFRIGLMLGVLGGLAFALVKVLGSRDEAVPAPAGGTPEPWPRLSTPEPTPAPPPPPPAPTAAPVPPPVVATEPAPVLTTPVEAIIEELAEVAAVVPPPPAPAAPAKPARKPAEAKKKAPAAAWVEPQDGVCPTSHPVKAKLTSKIFHLPGMLNYERTNPDRCYADAPKAEADGLRAAKR